MLCLYILSNTDWDYTMTDELKPCTEKIEVQGYSAYNLARELHANTGCVIDDDIAQEIIDIIRADLSAARIAELEAACERLTNSNLKLTDDWSKLPKAHKQAMATSRNIGLEEAMAACRGYRRGHLENMSRNGKSDYHMICSDAADRCIDRIEALKTEQGE